MRFQTWWRLKWPSSCASTASTSRGREAREQRVEEHDALGRAEAGEVGVAVARAPGAVHHVQAAGAEAAAREQRLDARRERSVGERAELVEQRRDEGRVDEQHQQVEARPGEPDPEPPQLAHARHQPEHQRQQRDAEQRRRPAPAWRGRRANSRGVMRLKPKRASTTKVRYRVSGSSSSREQHDHRDDERDAVRDAAERAARRAPRRPTATAARRRR